MIHGYAVEEERLRAVDAPLEALDRVVWLDLETRRRRRPRRSKARSASPSHARGHGGDRGIEPPLLGERRGLHDRQPAVERRERRAGPAPVTFILAGQRLVTLRYHDPRAFAPSGPGRARGYGCSDGPSALIALLEVTIDRLADILERIGREVEQLSRAVFRPRTKGRGPAPDYLAVLQGLGRHGDLLANVVDSLVTLERLVAFLSATNLKAASKDVKVRLKTMARDTRFLDDHASSLSQKLTLSSRRHPRHDLHRAERHHQDLLGGGSGLPAADADRLDLRHELRRHAGARLAWGYPFAIGLMVLSAVVSFGVFKSRGWL